MLAQPPVWFIVIAFLFAVGPLILLHELGHYWVGRWFGVRRHGRLVAMAGERLRVDGFGEVSGVCVDPSVRGEGLGAVVTLAASHGIRERGDTPMLHVRDGNDGAHRLYRRIGYETRRQVVVAVLRWDGG